jgi:excisionase family DNA binding protein
MSTLDDAIRETVQKAVAHEMEDLRRSIEALKDSIRAVQGEPPAEYLGADEAAKVAGVQPQTVRRWVARGQLRGHRAGRLVRVRADELRAFLAAGGAGGCEPPNDELLARRVFGR